MKPFKQFICSVLLLIILLPGQKTIAQCAQSLRSISYNSTFAGTGNNGWGFSYPKFDPSMGTLVSVNFKLVESVYEAFQLENDSSSSVSYNLNIHRNDSVSNSAFTSPLISKVTKNYGPYNLAASDGIDGSGPDYVSQAVFPVMAEYSITDSITGSVANFLGTNYTVFTYYPSTYTKLTGGMDYTLSNTVSDTMHITLTYYYCYQNILAEDLTNFFAKESNSTVKLSWEIENETAGRTYQVEESTDGKNFNNIGSLESVVNYAGKGLYGFTTSTGNEPLLYFRIKEIDADGSYKYSEIKTTEQENMNGLYLYPNPSNNFINVVFNQQEMKNWNVEIFSADGKIIQKNYFINSNNIHIPFASQLATGVYFIRAIDKQTQKKYTSSFIVK